jgi:GH24 family phage-related lysozyme (muramidase)
MNLAALKEEIKEDEGVVYEIYLDQFGFPTFGVGHLIRESDPEHGLDVGTPVPEARVNQCLDEDLESTVRDCHVLFPDFDNLTEEAQLVIANMMFNLGRTRLSKFRKFIGAVRESDWNEAGNQMVDSLWYTQVTNRAARLVQRIRNLA